MKKLLILGSCISSKEIIEYAKSEGIHTIVADPNGLSKRSAKQWSDESWMVDVSDLDTLQKMCREANVDGVVCGVSEFCIDKALDLCERLHKPFYCTKDTMHYSRDKADFKKAWREIGVPLAEDYFISPELTDEELDKVKYPVVVKPVDCCANTGISFCYNKEELRKGYKYALSVSHSTKIVVERMLQGEEWYSFYAMADGKVSLLALNAMYSQPGYPENCYSITTTVTDNIERFVKEANPQIEKGLAAIGCREGIAWVQLMLDKDGHFYVLEMGYRGDSEMMFLPYKELLGFNAVKMQVNCSLGIKNDPAQLPESQSHAFERSATSYMMWAKKDAVLKEVSGLDEVASWPGVYIGQWKDAGDEVAQHTSMATICFSNESIDDLCDMIDRINKTVKYIDQNGEDILIRYDQFDYLRDVNQRGLNGE